MKVTRTLALLVAMAVTGCGSGGGSAGVSGSGGGSAGGGSGGGAVDGPAPGTGGITGGSGTGGAPGDAAGPVPNPDASGCGGDSARPGDTTVMLMHGGATRSYILHVPPGYDGRSRVPLVVDIHGLTSNATEQAGVSGWRRKSDTAGFIVAYPNGLDASWNGGSLCCGMSQARGVDDEGFIRAVVAKIQQDACIDPRRLYATGLSNGGAMSHLLACRAADLFAATAPISMGNGTMPCQPARPLSVIMFRGTTDPLVPYAGGRFPGAQADFDQWSQLNQCPGAPATTNTICSTKSGCAGGAEVTLCTVNAGHVLYAQAAAQGAPIPDVVWEAFQRHTLP